VKKETIFAVRGDLSVIGAIMLLIFVVIGSVFLAPIILVLGVIDLICSFLPYRCDGGGRA
jgi:hypothetical protein